MSPRYLYCCRTDTEGKYSTEPDYIGKVIEFNVDGWNVVQPAGRVQAIPSWTVPNGAT